MTRYGVFVRSELPERVTPEGLDFLRRCGVQVDLDLREDGERAEKRDLLADCAWCRYCQRPAANPGAFFHSAARREPLENFSWLRLYIDLAEGHKDWVRACLELMAEAEGCVLFHCNAGKDRTAILAALVLGAAGAADCDIVADYTLSMAYIPCVYPDQPDWTRANGGRRASGGASPDNMQGLLDHIRGSYGDIRGYLAACGVSEGTLEKLREKFIGRP